MNNIHIVMLCPGKPNRMQRYDSHDSIRLCLDPHWVKEEIPKIAETLFGIPIEVVYFGHHEEIADTMVALGRHFIFEDVRPIPRHELSSRASYPADPREDEDLMQFLKDLVKDHAVDSTIAIIPALTQMLSFYLLAHLDLLESHDKFQRNIFAQPGEIWYLSLNRETVQLTHMIETPKKREQQA